MDQRPKGRNVIIDGEFSDQMLKGIIFQINEDILQRPLKREWVNLKKYFSISLSGLFPKNPN